MTNVDLVQLTEQTKKLSAMIVEDEIETNALLVSNFKNFFSSVNATFNAKDALETYKKDTPDVVFIDIMMPGIDGIELAKQIREIDSKQIIIVVSASNDINKISESIKIGVNSFIQKPIDTQKILDMLSTINSIVTKKRKIETKTFSISLPLDIYDLVHANAKGESISKNAVIIRALRAFYDQQV
jgi:DNA-binding NtrC family response regulator